MNAHGRSAVASSTSVASTARVTSVAKVTSTEAAAPGASIIVGAHVSAAPAATVVMPVRPVPSLDTFTAVHPLAALVPDASSRSCARRVAHETPAR